jgi:hypothetical protein
MRAKFELHFSMKWFGIGFGVVECKVEMQCVVINAPNALHNVQRLAMGMTGAIQPRMVV